jgi:hypothetical protein
MVRVFKNMAIESSDELKRIEIFGVGFGICEGKARQGISDNVLLAGLVDEHNIEALNELRSCNKPQIHFFQRRGLK